MTDRTTSDELGVPDLAETGVELVLLSDAAQVGPDGKLHIIGGGISFLTRFIPPSPDVSIQPTAFAIVVMFVIGWNDTNTNFPIHVSINDLDLRSTLFEATAHVIAGRPPHLVPGDPVYVPLAIPVLAHFPAAGHYVVEAALTYGGQRRIRRVRFTVVDAQPGPVPRAGC
jgi:hypothetical protein